MDILLLMKLFEKMLIKPMAWKSEDSSEKSCRTLIRFLFIQALKFRKCLQPLVIPTPTTRWRHSTKF